MKLIDFIFLFVVFILSQIAIKKANQETYWYHFLNKRKYWQVIVLTLTLLLGAVFLSQYVKLAKYLLIALTVFLSSYIIDRYQQIIGKSV